MKLRKRTRDNSRNVSKVGIVKASNSKMTKKKKKNDGGKTGRNISQQKKKLIEDIEKENLRNTSFMCQVVDPAGAIKSVVKPCLVKIKPVLSDAYQSIHLKKGLIEDIEKGNLRNKSFICDDIATAEITKSVAKPCAVKLTLIRSDANQSIHLKKKPLEDVREGNLRNKTCIRDDVPAEVEIKSVGKPCIVKMKSTRSSANQIVLLKKKPIKDIEKGSIRDETLTGDVATATAADEIKSAVKPCEVKVMSTKSDAKQRRNVKRRSNLQSTPLRTHVAASKNDMVDPLLFTAIAKSTRSAARRLQDSISKKHIAKRPTKKLHMSNSNDKNNTTKVPFIKSYNIDDEKKMPAPAIIPRRMANSSRCDANKIICNNISDKDSSSKSTIKYKACINGIPFIDNQVSKISECAGVSEYLTFLNSYKKNQILSSTLLKSCIQNSSVVPNFSSLAIEDTLNSSKNSRKKKLYTQQTGILLSSPVTESSCRNTSKLKCSDKCGDISECPTNNTQSADVTLSKPSKSIFKILSVIKRQERKADKERYREKTIVGTKSRKLSKRANNSSLSKSKIVKKVLICKEAEQSICEESSTVNKPKVENKINHTKPSPLEKQSKVSGSSHGDSIVTESTKVGSRYEIFKCDEEVSFRIPCNEERLSIINECTEEEIPRIPCEKEQPLTTINKCNEEVIPGIPCKQKSRKLVLKAESSIIKPPIRRKKKLISRKPTFFDEENVDYEEKLLRQPANSTCNASIFTSVLNDVSHF